MCGGWGRAGWAERQGEEGCVRTEEDGGERQGEEGSEEAGQDRRKDGAAMAEAGGNDLERKGKVGGDQEGCKRAKGVGEARGNFRWGL